MTSPVPEKKGNRATEHTQQRTSVVLKRLWRYLSGHQTAIVLAFLLSVTGNLLSLAVPKLSGYAIDAIGPGESAMAEVLRYVIMMLVLAVLSALFSWLLSTVLIRLSRAVVTKMRKDLYDHITILPVSFFDSHQTGDVISVLSYDVDTVGASIATDITQILTSIITVVGSFSMMIGISPVLLLVFLFTIPASVFFTRYRSRLVRPLFSKRSRALGQMNGFVEESVSGLRTIRAYHQEDEFNDRFEVRNLDASDSQWKADSASCITGPSVNLINNISLALISIFGSLLFMNGHITLGGVSTFILYSRKFSGPINEFANIISELQSTLAAAERVLNLIDLPPEEEDRPDALPVTDCEGRIEFRDVSFGYDPEQTVLHHISFTAKPGKVIAIVGETGCGKTTLINLLMRFYDVTEGAILLDGHDLRELRREDLRRQFTMVLQDTWLFDGTVAENLAYGRPDATLEEIKKAAEAAHIHDMILSMPQGYETPVSGSGNSISKGQKQLMTIARAMLISSSVLILDEATSNVDTRTELQIRDAMLQLTRGKTSFIIAHRLSTIMDADMILVMDKGHIVESGTHTELLKKQGAYAALYNAQFG